MTQFDTRDSGIQARHQVVTIMMRNLFPYPRLSDDVLDMENDLYWTLMGL